MHICGIKKVALGDKCFFVEDVYLYPERMNDLKDEGVRAHIILRENYPLLVIVCKSKYYLITPNRQDRNVANLLGLPPQTHTFRYRIKQEELILLPDD